MTSVCICSTTICVCEGYNLGPLVQSPKESWFLEDLDGASLNITPKESRFHTKRSLIKKIECIQHFWLLLKRSLLHAHPVTTASCQNQLSWYHSTSIHWASLGHSFNMQYPLRDGYRFSTNIKDYWRTTCLVSSSWLVLALCR